MAKKRKDEGIEIEGSENTVTILGGKTAADDKEPKIPPERMKLAEYRARTGLKDGVARGLLLIEGDAARTQEEWAHLVDLFRRKPTAVSWGEWKAQQS